MSGNEVLYGGRPGGSMSEINLLYEIEAKLKKMPPEERAELAKVALNATKAKFGLWVPNPGPQTAAYFSPADELFFGGQAGGAKTDLLIGLSLTAHKRSLILRRTNKEAQNLVERYAEIIGSREGWNGQDDVWRIDGRTIDIGGCQLEDDKQKRKGIPHDLKGFDEIGDFLESQYVFIIAWVRSTSEGQRSRVVCTGNPPTKPEGLWVLRRWGAWLDPRHPKPAKEGELRWYTTINGVDTEMDGPGPHTIPGEAKPVVAWSRTFIRSTLADNPDLSETNYDAALAALPEELRVAYREGKFDIALQDAPMQLIPTVWVQDAQKRWTNNPPQHAPMCAIGVDVARGGLAKTTLAARYDHWYAPIISVPGIKTPNGTDVAGLVVAHRRNKATIVIDMGGGYGGAPYEHLQGNLSPGEIVGYVGSNASTGRTKDRKLGFFNRRAETWWRFREALDPSQEGGSLIALPPDNELLGDLTSPSFEVRSGKILVEAKDAISARLARSPDKGDAVVMAWSEGATHLSHGETWRQAVKTFFRPQVHLGHDLKRRH